VKFALNTYSVIGDGLSDTIEIYKDTVRAMHRVPDVQVSIWPFYDADPIQIGYTGFLLRGTREDVDAILLDLPVDRRPQLQPVIT
jgi:hypothetical protein